MDEDKIAFSTSVELSFLDDQRQYNLLRIIEEQECTPSYFYAWHIHKYFNLGVLTMESIDNTFTAEKPNQKAMFNILIEKLQKIAPLIKDNDFESFITKACEHYYKFLIHQNRDRDSRCYGKTEKANKYNWYALFIENRINIKLIRIHFHINYNKKEFIIRFEDFIKYLLTYLSK